MAEKIFSLYRFIIELLIATGLYVYAFKRRNKFVIRLLLSLLLCCTVSTVYNHVLAQYFILRIIRYASLFFAVVLAVFICFDVNFRTSLFFVISGYVTQHFASRVLFFLEQFIPELPDYANVIIYIAVLFAVYAIFYFLFARRMKKMKDMTVKRGDIIVMCLLIVICMIVITGITQFSDYNTIPQKVVYLLYGLISCIMILVLQYGIFRNALGESERKELERIRESEKQNYEFKKETIDLINIKCHDLKHRLSVLNSKDVSENEVEELKKRIEIYDFSIRTGNDDLDLVIAEHSFICQQHNIEFEFMGTASALNYLSPLDIYSLFGNALDNAIEAVKKLPEEERSVSVNIKQIVEQVFIHIENPYVGTLKINGDTFITDKSDTDNHGFGIASMRATVKKYQGNIHIDTAGQIFKINVFLPLQKQSV